MEKKEINEIFFEDLHKSQMNSINKNSIEDARKIILNLLLYAQSGAIGDEAPGKDEAISEGLKWIENHVS